MVRQWRFSTRRARWAVAAPVIALLLQGCSKSTVAPDSALAGLVGNWQATAFVLTEVSDTTVHLDLIQLGATFSLNVQPSGQYTAILVYNGQPATEIGQMSVSGDSITLNPTTPASSSATTGTYQLNGSQLTIDGDTEFDFNLDGKPDPARAHIELVKQ